jgi:hypothetical protein
MNDMNLHEVTSIKVGQVETLERSNGETFVTRRIIFESKDRGTFGVTAYGDEASELSITFE